MKKLGRMLLWMVAALAILLVAGISFTIGWRPFIGPRARPLTARKFEAVTAAVGARAVSRKWRKRLRLLPLRT